jgi:hypothetical protein
MLHPPEIQVDMQADPEMAEFEVEERAHPKLFG